MISSQPSSSSHSWMLAPTTRMVQDRVRSLSEASGGPVMSPNQATHLGDLSDTHCCAMCDGEGFQLELVWMGGDPHQEPEEHDVRCYGCQGYGEGIRLVCGRCGEEDFAHPDEHIQDFRQCAGCGHEAPNALWLPMQHHTSQEKAG